MEQRRFPCGRNVFQSDFHLAMLENGKVIAGPSGRALYDDMVERGETENRDALAEYHNGFCTKCGSDHWRAR